MALGLLACGAPPMSDTVLERTTKRSDSAPLPDEPENSLGTEADTSATGPVLLPKHPFHSPSETARKPPTSSSTALMDDLQVEP
jgi:hypothetical protein